MVWAVAHLDFESGGQEGKGESVRVGKPFRVLSPALVFTHTYSRLSKA